MEVLLWKSDDVIGEIEGRRVEILWRSQMEFHFKLPIF